MICLTDNIAKDPKEAPDSVALWKKAERKTNALIVLVWQMKVEICLLSMIGL